MALHYADAIHALSREIKASAQVATLADLLSGLSAVKTGAGVEGLRRIESAIETLTQLNTLHRQSLLALIYGEALNHLGRHRQAIDTLKRGREKAVETGEIRWKGELERVLTRLQLEAKDISPTAAEIQLKKSILHSDTYGDRMYRLRSIRDLAKILFEQGRKAEAYKLLHEDYQWFTEGRNGVDLRETAGTASRPGPVKLSVQQSEHPQQSNHYHIVLHINLAGAGTWTHNEVIKRWHQPFTFSSNSGWRATGLGIYWGLALAQRLRPRDLTPTYINQLHL